MADDQNYLFAEEPIKARLREALGPAVPVEGIGSTEELSSAKFRFPGVFVLYAGDTVEPVSAGAGAASQAVQHWIVSVGVKSSETLATGAAARREAGTLFRRAVTALMGHEVAPHVALERVTCPAPVLYHGGHVFLAAEFVITLDMSGGINV